MNRPQPDRSRATSHSARPAARHDGQSAQAGDGMRMNLPAAGGVYQSKPRRSPVQPAGSTTGQGGTTQARAAGTQSMRTAVIVLGDLGRSPRMQYHAVSLADGRKRCRSDRPRGRGGDAGGGVESAHSRAPPARPRVPNRAKGGVRRFVFSSAARGLGQAMRLLSHAACAFRSPT